MPEVVLGEQEGEGFVGDVSAIERDSRGRYLVYHRHSRGSLFVFDSAGTFLRTVGGMGEGPGEFRAVSLIQASPGDTLLVFDPRLRRLTILSPTFELVSVRPIPDVVFPTNGTGFLPDGSYVVSHHIRTSDRVGLPLQQVDPDGALRRSFGSVHREYRHDAAVTMLRRVAAAPDGRIWSARVSAYVLEAWDREGNRVDVLERTVEWFEPWERDNPFGPDHELQPRVVDISVDSAGRIWTLVHIPDPEWRDGLVRIEHGWDIADVNAVFDTVLEVIEPETGRVLWSDRFGRALYGFIDGGFVYGYREDEMGTPFIDVWRVIVN